MSPLPMTSHIFFVFILFWPPASPPPVASSIRQTPAGPPRSHRKRERLAGYSGQSLQFYVAECSCGWSASYVFPRPTSLPLLLMYHSLLRPPFDWQKIFKLRGYSFTMQRTSLRRFGCIWLKKTLSTLQRTIYRQMRGCRERIFWKHWYPPLWKAEWMATKGIK